MANAAIISARCGGFRVNCSGNDAVVLITSDESGRLLDEYGREYCGAVSGSGVYFRRSGSPDLLPARWIEGSSPVTFVQSPHASDNASHAASYAALQGFQFTFYQPGPGQFAHALFRSPYDFTGTVLALRHAGFRRSAIDVLNAYQWARRIKAVHYRSAGDARARNSGHVILHRPNLHSQGISQHTTGEMHFGEVNPNRRPLAHVVEFLRAWLGW